MSFLQPRNGALMANPPVAPIDITIRGSDWLWAVFTVMALSTLFMIFWRHSRSRGGSRIFHDLAIIILATSTIAYFAMASDLGATPVLVEFLHSSPPGTSRAIWYVRYIQWFINFPLLLLLILLAIGHAPSDILLVLFLAILVVVSGLVGALVHSVYKWGFFVFGLAGLFYIIFHLFAPSRRNSLGPNTTSTSASTSNTTSNNTHTHTHTPTTHPHTLHSSLLTLLLLLYPISWALSEGSNTISPDSEMVFYGILDLVAGPVFLMLSLWRLGRGGAGYGGEYGGGYGGGAGAGNVNGVRGEKNVVGPGVAGAGAGMGTTV